MTHAISRRFGGVVRARGNSGASTVPGRARDPEADGYLRLVDTIEGTGLRGGQIYDALVAVTATAANAVLLTRDRRAEAAYRAVEARVRFVD